MQHYNDTPYFIASVVHVICLASPLPSNRKNWKKKLKKMKKEKN